MKVHSVFSVAMLLLAAVCLGVAVDRLFLSATDDRTESEAIVSRKMAPAQKRGVMAARKKQLGERAKRNAAIKAERMGLLRDAKADREIAVLISELKELLKDELTPAERKMVRALDAALGAEDAKSVRSLVREAHRIGNSEVRKIAVAAAGWIGEEAMLELQEFMLDDDSEVAQEALWQWELALQECADETKKLSLLQEVLLKTEDEGTCDYLSIHLIICENTDLALKTIENLVNSSNSACKGPAKDSYEWITGKEWTGKR